MSFKDLTTRSNDQKKGGHNGLDSIVSCHIMIATVTASDPDLRLYPGHHCRMACMSLITQIRNLSEFHATDHLPGLVFNVKFVKIGLN